jgi:hypothetical protein
MAGIFPNSASALIPAPSITPLGGGITQVLFTSVVTVADPVPIPYHPVFQFGMAIRFLQFAGGGCSTVDLQISHLCNCDGPDIVANLTARYGCNCQGHMANPTSPWVVGGSLNMYQKTLTLSGDTWAWGTTEEVSFDVTGIFNACITGTMRLILSR